MSGIKVFAILLIIAGTLGMVYHQISYAGGAWRPIGGVGVAVSNHMVNIPIWAAVTSIIVGSLILLAHHRPRYRT
jgi:hypothetical protein